MPEELEILNKLNKNTKGHVLDNLAMITMTDKVHKVYKHMHYLNGLFAALCAFDHIDRHDCEVLKRAVRIIADKRLIELTCVTGKTESN